MGSNTLYISRIKLGICSTVSVIGHACLAWNGHHPRSARLGAPRGERQSSQTLWPCRDLTVRGVHGRFYADCDLRLGPFGRSGLVWRAGSDVSRSAEVWDCAEVEVPTFRERFVEQRCPWEGKFSPREGVRLSASLPPSTHHHENNIRAVEHLTYSDTRKSTADNRCGRFGRMIHNVPHEGPLITRSRSKV